MERTAVKSSNIKSIGFKQTSEPKLAPVTNAEIIGTVEIEFLNGSIYQHLGVPKCVFDGVMDAPSIGAAYHIAIKKQYTGVKIQDARAAVCKPVGDQLAGTAAYHAHLDICTQCREHPMEQCPVGQALLVAAVRS